MSALRRIPQRDCQSCETAVQEQMAGVGLVGREIGVPDGDVEPDLEVQQCAVFRSLPRLPRVRWAIQGVD